jgi:cell division protein YceG involved in septum cleavage
VPSAEVPPPSAEAPPPTVPSAEVPPPTLPSAEAPPPTVPSAEVPPPTLPSAEDPPPAAAESVIPPAPEPAPSQAEPPPLQAEFPLPAVPVPVADPRAGLPPLAAPARGGRSRRQEGAPKSPPAGRRGRSLPARAGALLALAAAIVAAVLLVLALRSSGHKPPAAPPPVVKLVVPEGKTRLQIAQIAAAAGLTGSYRSQSRRSPLLDPAHYGAPHGTNVLEGFLFPATYDLLARANVRKLIDDQLLTFRERFSDSQIRSAHRLGVTPYALLTVASMVEREALTAHDRPLIAAVIYNRLRQKIPLGIDATIYYAVELKAGIATYTHELTTAQLQIESPYNTRTHTGLPPTPISNPGMASIEAAAHPAHVGYLYYVAGADGCGEQVFSTTLAQFEQNAAAYRAAVSKNGGNPPTCKSK